MTAYAAIQNPTDCNLNKRAQRALGRSPEEKFTVDSIIENPRGII